MKKLLSLIAFIVYSHFTIAGGASVNTAFSPNELFLNVAPNTVTSGNFIVTMTGSGGYIYSDQVTVSAFIGGNPTTLVGISSGVITFPYTTNYNVITSTVSYFVDLTQSGLQSGTVSGYFKLFTSPSTYNFYNPDQIPFNFVIANPLTDLNSVPTMSEAISIFPNPISQGFVDIATDQPFTAEFYDMNGKLVISKTGQGNARIPLATKGAYILNVRTASRTTTRKILVE